MQLRSLVVSFVLALPTTVLSQNTLVAPNGFATVAGNGSNTYPWNRGTAPMHYMQVHSAQNFTLQGVPFPVLISRLRFRAGQSNASSSWTGGTWSNVVVNMSTAATTYLTTSTTFASNHGPNLSAVYTGPVSVIPGAGNGAGVPGPWHIDIAFPTPFLYNPGSGDLCLELGLDGVGWNGGAPSCDAVQSPAQPALCTRVYNTTSATAPTGSTDGYNYGLVTEFTYVPASGFAYSSPYGAGCYDRALASFYQLFGNGTFNLGNTSVQMVPSGSGYVVIAGGTQWWTPVGANLNLTDNALSAAQPLGFTFNYPGGSTTGLYVSSNGYVWLQSSTNNGCCAGLPSALLTMGPRICPLWNDLNPAAGGTVVYDVDAPNQVAYVTFTNVPETGTSNLNTFQVAIFASGIMEMRWRNCAVTGHAVLTGWSPGNGVRDPGSVNISASLPIVTSTDLTALALRASARPVMGSNINLVTSNIPASTPVGAVILSNTQHSNGISLAAIGMPGCRQYVGLDFNVVFPVAGTTANFALGIPSNPVLTGVRVTTQSATFSQGQNPLGVLATNGLLLVLDLQ